MLETVYERVLARRIERRGIKNGPAKAGRD
ncbi:hypothetical protein, partial [Parasphingorhabdus sp.]